MKNKRYETKSQPATKQQSILSKSHIRNIRPHSHHPPADHSPFLLRFRYLDLRLAHPQRLMHSSRNRDGRSTMLRGSSS
jgi:hypothetical protein